MRFSNITADASKFIVYHFVFVPEANKFLKAILQRFHSAPTLIVSPAEFWLHFESVQSGSLTEKCMLKVLNKGEVTVCYKHVKIAESYFISFIRDGLTWLIYIVFKFYGCFSYFLDKFYIYGPHVECLK